MSKMAKADKKVDTKATTKAAAAPAKVDKKVDTKAASAKAAPAKAAPKVDKKAEEKKKKEEEERKKKEEEDSDDDDEDDDEDDDSEEDSDEEEDEKKAKDSDDDDEDDDEEDSDEEEEDEKKEDSDDDDEDDDEDDEEDSKKRKRDDDDEEEEDEDEQPAKKQNVESAKIFVGSLAFSVTEDALKKTFGKFGKIASVALPQNDQGKSKGFAFIEYENADSASKALKLDQTDLEGRTIKVAISDKKDKDSGDRRQSTGKPMANAGSESKTLFVGNLSFQTTKDSLYGAFEGFDGLKDARVATEKETERPRGFGYVEFEDVASAKAAFAAMGGADIDGRSIRLDYAPERDRSESGGGRGGFRGGDRGGFRGGRGGDRGRGGFRGGRGGDRGRGGFRGGDRGGFRGGRGGFRGGDFGGKKTTFSD